MLLFTDGFDWSGVINDYTTTNKWTTRSGASIGNTTGTLRFGAGSGAYINGNQTGDYLLRAIGQNLAAGCMGIAMRRDTSSSYDSNVFILFDTTSNVQMGLKNNVNGTFSVYRQTHSNILGTSTFAITANTWHYIELKWKINNSVSTGDVEVYVDGVSILAIAAGSDTQATANAYATHYCIYGNQASITSPNTNNYYYDDHYLVDFTGSHNNAPLGNVRIQTLYPNGNGNTSGFTGSDGNSVNNYQQVDETSLITSDYNDGTALNQKDTYTFTDTVSTTNAIYAVVINHVSLRTDTDPRSVAAVIRHSGTDYDGANMALGASALNYQEVYELNPGTSSGWTKSDVDAAEFGLKVTV